MAVEREKLGAAFGVVAKDYDGAVVLWRGIVGEGVDSGVEGSKHRRAGFDEQVDAQMNRTAFIGRIRGGLKKRRRVHGPRLIVLADGHARAALGKETADLERHAGLGRIGRIRADERAANAEVEDEAISLRRSDGIMDAAEPPLAASQLLASSTSASSGRPQAE